MCVIHIIVFAILLTNPILTLPINKNHVEIHETVLPKVMADEVLQIVSNTSTNNNTTEVNRNVSGTRNTVRPGMTVNTYDVELEPDAQSGTFRGRVMIHVNLASGTEADGIIFYVRDLTINSVQYAIRNGEVLYDADFGEDNGLLEIWTGRDDVLTYRLVIEYIGILNSDGLYLGTYNDNSESYIAMNLHPTHARSVFPCIDESTESSIISFTFNNFGYSNLITNSLLEPESSNQYRSLQGPAKLWGMVAHNFNNYNIPAPNVLLYGRAGISNQDSLAATAINFYFNGLNEWTNKPYSEIINDQNDIMSVIGLPDSAKKWFALSMVCVWEPYLFMENTHSVKQRKTALIEIAEAMAGQWLGYVVYPINWRYDWVVTGLRKYAAFQMALQFQSNSAVEDPTLLDINTIFVTDIIQESLYHDAYSNAFPLETPEDFFEEDEIRMRINGVVKYKAPALMWMLKQILAAETEDDYLKMAARDLLGTMALDAVSAFDFYDAINSVWMPNSYIGNVQEYLEPWVTTNGYPLIHVGLRQGGVILTQERFGYSAVDQLHYNIPITYSVSTQPNFENTVPVAMMENTYLLNVALDAEEREYVLFNVQGQGYYRVNYDVELWERIIEALSEPELRQQIHPLNRATLLDDALNLARASKLDYDIALRVVLAMEHETEYAVWKAFVRNMKFLKNHLVPHVLGDEDLDPEIYLRMVRRSIITFENEIGFYPDPLVMYPAMESLTRGLVMDHACRANYQPCIAAAVDWFYDENSIEPTVNPNIPHEIRPAVYCTMVREGGEDVIAVLNDRLQIENIQYERVVILESFACSTDEAFITNLLLETIAANNPYTTEERFRIFAAVADSGFENTQIAINFISMRTIEIRQMYGGPEKLEECISILAESVGDWGLAADFERWVNSGINNLDDSKPYADEALMKVVENMQWNELHLQYVYDWIDENDAPTLVVSMALLIASITIALLN